MKTTQIHEGEFTFFEAPAPKPEKPKADAMASIKVRKLPTLREAKANGEKGIKRVEKNAREFDPVFASNAFGFIPAFLSWQPDRKASGEVISDECVKKGIIPHDMRAFGPVFQKLVKAGIIEKTGETCLRKRGNGTTGGNIWRLKP